VLCLPDRRENKIESNDSPPFIEQNVDQNTYRTRRVSITVVTLIQ
jgi:hypothetical protein